MPIAFYSSPIGEIKIEGESNFISGVSFVTLKGLNSKVLPDSIKQCLREIDLYFNEELREFHVLAMQKGTVFQQRVWNELRKIPYGKTISYIDIARALGNPESVRAVGMTNGKNAIGIIIPCHRVIGANGALIGYAGELWRKKWLLEHERNHALGIMSLF